MQPGGVTRNPDLSIVQYRKVNVGTMAGIVFGPERKLQEVDGLTEGSSTKDGSLIDTEGSGFGPQSEVATNTEDIGTQVSLVSGAESRGYLNIDQACISALYRPCLFIST